MRISGALLVLLSLLARSIDLLDVDLAMVADGTYEATYTISPPVMAANKTVTVKVTGATITSAAVLKAVQLAVSGPAN